MIGYDEEQKNAWYLDIMKKSGTWILIFTNFVPISLMVTVEVVKFMQAQFIGLDWMMYDPEKDMPAKAQSSNLNEELGLVKVYFLIKCIVCILRQDRNINLQYNGVQKNLCSRNIIW
jgi:phospholipid-transporting ATPase